MSLSSNLPVCQVDESTEREEGWLYGSRQGKMGWFPESYVERVAPSDAANSAAAVAPKGPLQSQLSNALEAVKAAGTKSAFTPTHSPNPAPAEAHGQVSGLNSLYGGFILVPVVWTCATLECSLCCAPLCALTAGGG